MCRHLAYLGPTTGLRSLLFDAAHSLAHQAEHPCHQVSGDSNPDGWGVAWYPRPGRPPSVYRTVTPIWDDQGFAKYSGELRAHTFVAAARLASPGARIDETGNAPFVDGRWSFSLNGIVHGFTEEVGDELRSQLDDRRRAALAGDADTEVLFALVLQQIEAGTPPPDALAAVITDVLGRTTGRLNLLLGGDGSLYATRVGNSLFRSDHVIASEPTDDVADWHEIADHSLTVLTPRGATDTPL